jgi:ABC-type branched-subunit amino acid transport system ATPase component
MASIRTAGLTKDFGDLRAVNEIDLDLPEGGVAGFVGPNGAVQQTHHPDAVRNRTEPAQGVLLSVNRVQTGYADAADGEPSIDPRNADTDLCHRTPASFNRFPQLS